MKTFKLIFTNSILLLASLLMIFPMIWMVIYSFKSYPESYKSIVDLIFSPFTLINYTDTLDSDAFLSYFANSVFVAAIVTAGNLVFCLFAAYALVRKDFFGKALIYTTISGVMIPGSKVLLLAMTPWL